MLQEDSVYIYLKQRQKKTIYQFHRKATWDKGYRKETAYGSTINKFVTSLQILAFVIFEEQFLLSFTYTEH